MLIVALMTAGVAPVGAADESRDRTVGDVRVVLGVVPAALLTDHPEQHEEAAMHDGLPAGRGYYHVLVALFDRRSGARITKAEVGAQVGEVGLGTAPIELKPMNTGGVVTFGNFVAMPGMDPYQITVTVRTVKGSAPVDVTFVYRRQ